MAASLIGNPKEKWIRSFTVTDPTKHEKGFTVYKITYKAFSLNQPDDVIEVVVWKRYNDFKKLHKTLSALHFHLRRPEKFPEFAKAKFFGRYDGQVIEERRQSALKLLEFAASVPPLTRNTYFTKFFEGGEELTSLLPTTPKTSLLQPQIITPVDDSDPPKTNNESTPTEDGSNGAKKDTIPGPTETKNGLTPPLGGIWLHRQVEDDEAVDYGDVYQVDDDDDDDDDRTTFSEDSVPSTPLPQLQDLALFDPLSTDVSDNSEGGTIPHSNSWLFHAMDVCAELNQDTTELPQGVNSVTDTSTDTSDSGITINFAGTASQSTPSELSVSDSAILSTNDSNVATPGLPPPDTSGQLPPDASESKVGSKDSRSSMARAYLNSIRAQHAASIDSVHHDVVDSRSGSGSGSGSASGTPEKRSRTSSTYSASDLVIGGVEDYLYQAARHISLALDNEANANYQMAFDLYKEGVGILLKGVIGDNNKTRREAVRRKTAQYLMKAEDLYNKHLSAAAANARRWDPSQQMIIEFDSSSAHLKAPVEDLKSYKVLGIVDRVLLVLDMVSYQTYAIKVLRKYPVVNKGRRTMIPSDCPYMVKLYKYFETDCSIFLILEHATGGKLWTYASAYLRHDLTNRVPLACSLEMSIGSRGSRRSRTSSSISGLEERVRRISGGEDNVFEDESPRKVSSKTRIERVDEDVSAQTEHPDNAAGDLELEKEFIFIDESATFQPDNISTPQKKSLGLDAELATLPGLSESPEVASSYANIFNVAKNPPAISNSEDFMHIEDVEETGSNLNDLVQVSSQYDDVIADDSLGLSLVNQSAVSLYNESVYTGSDLSGHNKSFNSTVQQVNNKPPPITLFSIDSSDSPEVQSSESLDRPAFRYSPDNADFRGSLEGLGQLQEEDENGKSEGKNHDKTLWPSHNPNNVMADAMKAMEVMERDDTKDKPNIDSHFPPDTSGFGAVYRDSSLSNPGMDLSEFFDNSEDDRPRTVSSPVHDSYTSFDNHDYSPSKLTMGQKSSSTSGLSFGDGNSFETSKPKSSLDDLLQPSNTNDIESEWEKSARTKISVDTSGFLNKTDHSQDDVMSKDNLNNGANTSNRELNTETVIDSNGGTLTPVVVSGSESIESSTTPKELPSSIYSSTQSTPKHSMTIANSKMADWPGDVQSDVHAQLKATRQNGDAPKDIYKNSDEKQVRTEKGKKSELPDTRLPSLSTFLAQMDEATAKHASATTLPESCVRMWAAEIVIALANLHSIGIICKDLRPHNILLAEGGHIRLTYFSQWKCVEPELSSYACDHFYTAPEVKGVYDVTEASDWWSLGAILFELLTSKPLYTCHPSGINSHTQVIIPDHVSTEAKGLMEQLLQVNPLERLGSGMSGVEDVKAHPFFHGIDWNIYRG